MKLPNIKFKAAILTELRKPLIIDEISLPSELKPGQVLVKVHFSGICGSQIGEIEGVKGFDHFLPHLLGHEGSGTVLETGPGVKHVKKEDLVVMHWKKGLGIDSAPPSYKWGSQVVNAGWITTFNEYAIVSENRLTAISSNVDKECAALFGCAVTTGFGVITNNAKLKIGESLVVYGAGGVGLNIIQAAAMTSAHPIIAVDIHPGRLQLATEMGATHTIDANSVIPQNEIKAIIGDSGLDVFVDNTGIPEIIETGYELTSSRGRVILVGVPKAGNKTSIFTLPLHFGKTVSGSHGGEAVPEIDIPRYLSLSEAGKMKLKNLITHRVSLSEINNGLAGMKNGTISGRVLVTMD
ncbi:Zn-dependent alcohol dehydrogenase, class III [SAR116 cluster alpha proteobacterium HIMB100]|nr:Zn-dependent alcohol dehydrogenase, class III [SAR116 cluster alpha proteobacterium HIMB100]